VRHHSPLQTHARLRRGHDHRTDEHGVNVERSEKSRVVESNVVAKMAAEWRALWETGVQGDEFIRTTDLKHATLGNAIQAVP